MLVFRCTHRVVRRFHLPLTEKVTASTGVLGDWYANLIYAGRVPWVLCQSEQSLLPVLLRARKDTFPGQFGLALARLWRRLGIPDDRITLEIEAAADLRFARPMNRKVLGVLNDFGSLAKDDLSPTGDMQGAVEVALRLAQTLSSPIAYTLFLAPGPLGMSCAET